MPDVLAALHRERRDVVGAGGIGKTTMAIAAARAYADLCPDGLCLADLATIDDPTLLPRRTGDRALPPLSPLPAFAAIPTTVSPPYSTIWCRGGCSSFSTTASMWRPPQLSLHAAWHRRWDGRRSWRTSREPLGFDMEFLIRIGPLAVPDGSGLSLQRASPSRP